MGELANLMPSILAGAVTGLTTWGAMRVEMRWLRRDVDNAHRRIDRLQDLLTARGVERRAIGGGGALDVPFARAE